MTLNIKVKQTVRVKLGKLKLFKVKFRVRCRLVVDNLSANNYIRLPALAVISGLGYEFF